VTWTRRAMGRLLIVDDDGATTQTFARILTLEGYDVRTATTAEVALCENDSWRPDAIILDLWMPFINGLGFLYRLRGREDRRDTPVVMVTGDQCLEDTIIDEIHELGAELYFKPLWLEDLVTVVRKLVPVSRQLELPDRSNSSSAAPTLLH
jgi:DNA-binding response OmpR family regulator